MLKANMSFSILKVATTMSLFSFFKLIRCELCSLCLLGGMKLMSVLLIFHCVFTVDWGKIWGKCNQEIVSCEQRHSVNVYNFLILFQSDIFNRLLVRSETSETIMSERGKLI